MAETGMPRAGMATAAEILAPSPGALLRRRMFRHWGLADRRHDPPRRSC